ncbi:MAG: CpsB/CapC family capsule biosynthesis tyrosine phosphatase, partial [Ferruginibacter sp.]
DDGSPDVETSIQLVKGLKALGISRSIATPHIIGDMYRNDADSIFGAQQSLQSALDKEGIVFELSAAAEYMLDNYFFELLDNKAIMLTVKDKLLLTEFSYSAMPSYPEKMSFAIITEGYTPILAHPERYGYYHRDHSFYHRLKDLGFLLQVNLLSLTGYYGKEVAAAGRYILKNDLASFVATDLHHHRHLDALIHFSQQKDCSELFKAKKWNEEFE